MTEDQTIRWARSTLQSLHDPKPNKEGLWGHSFQRGALTLKTRLKNTGYSLADINVTEEELESLRVTFERKGAEYYLSLLKSEHIDRRSWKLNPSSVARCLREHLAAAQLSLEDIGVSASEVEELRKKHHVHQLNFLMTQLRSARPERAGDIYWDIERELKISALTPDSIGTTWEELEKLRSPQPQVDQDKKTFVTTQFFASPLQLFRP